MKSKGCKRATELISLSLDRPLGAIERLEMHTHLLPCGMCRRARKQLVLIEKSIRAALLRNAVAAPSNDGDHQLSAEATRRIKQGLSMSS